MNVKKLMEDGYSANDIQKELQKEITAAQAELDAKQGLDESRKNMTIAIIDYLIALGVLKETPDESMKTTLNDLIKTYEKDIKKISWSKLTNPQFKLHDIFYPFFW